MRLLGVRFRIILYIRSIYILVCPCPCTHEWVFPMYLHNGYFQMDLPKWIFPCPNEWIPDSRILRYVCYYYHRSCIDQKQTPVEIFDSNHIVKFSYYYFFIFFASLLFMSTRFPLLMSVWVISPMMRSLNIPKIYPWFDLVSNSPVISPLGHHSTDMLPLKILYVIRKVSNIDVFRVVTAQRIAVLIHKNSAFIVLLFNIISDSISLIF